MSKSIKQDKALKEIRKKINYKTNGRPFGSKNRATKIKEEAELSLREQYINQVKPHFKEITDINLNEAKNPKNTKEREGVIEQLIDRPKQRTEVDVSIDKLEVLSDKIKEILER